MSITSALNAIMQEEIDSNNAVGTVLLVYKNNKQIYNGIFGKDNLNDDKPIKLDSIFKMFSMTKPITSFATHMCMERGLFKDTDPVYKYIPEFKELQIIKEDGEIVKAQNTMTIRHLLDMTAGLEYPNDFSKSGFMLGKELFWPMESNYPDIMIPTVELMKKVAGLPLIDEPGNRWNYSLCADVLAAIIEIVTGQRYSEFLKKNIFEPLGMVDTDFYVPEEKYDRLVTMHDKTENGYVPWDYPFLGTFCRKYKPEFESGGAGLCSTPIDYTKFALCLANGGTLPKEYSKTGEAVTLIEKETALLMQQSHLVKEQRIYENWDSLKGYNYGNLMRHLENNEEAYLHKKIGLGEYGWDGWAGTYVSIDPVNDIVFLYFINVTNGNREWQMKKLKNALYGELEAIGEI